MDNSIRNLTAEKKEKENVNNLQARTGNRSVNPNVKDPEHESYQSTIKMLSKIDV